MVTTEYQLASEMTALPQATTAQDLPPSTTTTMKHRKKRKRKKSTKRDGKKGGELSRHVSREDEAYQRSTKRCASSMTCT